MSVPVEVPRIVEHCGLRLRTDLPVPLPTVDGDGWDLEVRWGSPQRDSEALPPGEVLAAFGDDEDRWYTATRTDDGYLLRFRRCGEFVISADLRAVVVRPDPVGEHEILPVLLLGTCIAFVLALRGETVLHASAVTVPGGALAIVGHSGQGKSTLAALLCQAGRALVTDDVLVVRPGPPVTCVGGASELRLRSPATALLDPDGAARIRATEDDRTGYRPPLLDSGPHPLAAVVVPLPSRTATQVEHRRLAASDAIFGLLAIPRVHGWRSGDVLQRDFAVLGALANTVPVHEVTVPWGPPFDAAVVPALLDLASGGRRT